MDTDIQGDRVFDIVNWPILAIAFPIIGVITGIIGANIGYRLWNAGHVPAPIVVVLLIVPMILAGFLFWFTPRGQILVNQQSLVMDRIFFFDRHANYAGAELTLVRWYPDRTLTARGVQLWINDGNSVVKIGVASQPVMDDFDERYPALIEDSTTRMPQAVLAADDFSELLNLLAKYGLSVNVLPVNNHVEYS